MWHAPVSFRTHFLYGAPIWSYSSRTEDRGNDLALAPSAVSAVCAVRGRPEMNRLQALCNAAFCSAYPYSGLARLQKGPAHRSGRRFTVVLVCHRLIDVIPDCYPTGDLPHAGAL